MRPSIPFMSDSSDFNDITLYGKGIALLIKRVDVQVTNAKDKYRGQGRQHHVLCCFVLSHDLVRPVAQPLQWSRFSLFLK